MQQTRPSRVEETADAAFGSLLEFLVNQDDGRDLRISGKHLVELGQVLVHQLIHALVLQVVFLVGIDQRDDFALSAHHKRLDDTRQVVHLVLNLFRIDVLTIGAQDLLA